MRVLIGDISSYKAIAVSAFLRKNYPDISLFGFDSRGFAENLHSKQVSKCFTCDDEDLDGFLNLIENNDIDFFIPVINSSLNLFWRNKEKFGKALSYLGEYAHYELLNDKNRLHELAEGLGIKVPARFQSLEDTILPAVVKPTNLSSAKGVEYLRNTQDLAKVELPQPYIIQEFVEGEGVGYSFYARSGRILNGYGHRRLAEYPVSGGSSMYRTSYADKRMEEIAEKIVAHLGYTGFAMFEFKLTEDDELYLLEVNPRIWGSINQGLANGTNYFEGILGPTTFDSAPGRILDTYFSPFIYLSLILYLLKGNTKPLGRFLGNLPNNKADVSLIGDPRGYLSTILRKLI